MRPHRSSLCTYAQVWTDLHIEAKGYEREPGRVPIWGVDGTVSGPLFLQETPEMKKLLLMVVAAAAGALALKRQRDRELDEAIWEEPREL